MKYFVSFTDVHWFRYYRIVCSNVCWIEVNCVMYAYVWYGFLEMREKKKLCLHSIDDENEHKINPKCLHMKKKRSRKEKRWVFESFKLR